MFEPKVLDDIYGQDHIIPTLKTMDLGGAAIFFEGGMGTGKSSMAHVLASMFCKSVHNIQHINCGQFSKVEQIREIVFDFYESSFFGRNKCYIFDEPQLLSTKAMNTMLVPCDKLPDNLLIILCSAEPQSVAKMLPERFIRFRTRAMNDKTSGEFVTRVCKDNNILLDKIKRTLVIERCEGNPRRIIKAIPKILNISEIKDIEYLLDMNAFEEDEEILDFFKVVISWKVPLKAKMAKLRKLLKEKTPEAVRVGMMSLIGNGVISGYGDGQIDNLNIAYKVLKEATQFPEKATLIMAITDIDILTKEKK